MNPSADAADKENVASKIGKIMGDNRYNIYYLPRQGPNKASAYTKSLVSNQYQKHENPSRATNLLECKRNAGTSQLAGNSG